MVLLLRAVMLFGATFGCARCRLRFALRASCPSCGGTTILALTTREGRTRYRSAAQRGAGLWQRILVVLAALAAKLGVTVTPRERRLAPARSRVFEPPTAARGETTLTGIARRASAEIASALAEEPCLLFGVRGAVGAADVADADGGDFDLELPSGERVLVSLEHAMLVAPAAAPVAASEMSLALTELLEQRAVFDAEGSAVLGEVLLRDGDEVTVTGTILGGKVTSLGRGVGRGARVLGGDAQHPVAVQIASAPA